MVKAYALAVDMSSSDVQERLQTKLLVRRSVTQPVVGQISRNALCILIAKRQQQHRYT